MPAASQISEREMEAALALLAMKNSVFRFNGSDVQCQSEVRNDMVPIGDGHAKVPRTVLGQIDWQSYTNATRKLLTAVFPRSVLATHSLTGKASPAFPGKPAKGKLSAALVKDIIQTVVDKCRVPENLVRTSITTKCADESKMLRGRQEKEKEAEKELKRNRKLKKKSRHLV